MEIHLPPDVQEKLEQLAVETGRPVTEFVQDAVTGYLTELAEVRKTLDSRYDDIASGRVRSVDGEEAFSQLIAKTEAQRKRRA
jgi:predicted transcriptional regulator